MRFILRDAVSCGPLINCLSIGTNPQLTASPLSILAPELIRPFNVLNSPAFAASISCVSFFGEDMRAWSQYREQNARTEGR